MDLHKNNLIISAQQISITFRGQLETMEIKNKKKETT